MIAVVTDSNCMLPPALADAANIAVIPIPVLLDEVEFREGVDLDADEFYERIAAGASVTTSQPSPGEIAGVYAEAIASGADQIVSIHVGKHLSGTLNSARIAAGTVGVPVEIVDSGTASFPIGLAALAAASAASGGATIDQVIAAANATIVATRNAFVLSALDFVRTEGRVRVTMPSGHVAGIPVVAMYGDELSVLGDASDVAQASDLMVDVLAKETLPCRVGIGVGGREAFDFYPALRSRVESLPMVAEVIEYRCGPTVGAYSGPGVAGMAWAPI